MKLIEQPGFCGYLMTSSGTYQGIHAPPPPPFPIRGRALTILLPQANANWSTCGKGAMLQQAAAESAQGRESRTSADSIASGLDTDSKGPAG